MSRFKLKRTAPFLVWLILIFSATVLLCAQETARAPKRVLLIHDYGQESAGRAILDQNFQNVLRTAPLGSIEFYSETLEMYRFPGEDHVSLLHDYLRKKYAGIKIDVIVAILDTSLEFMQRYRDELFPGVPIVYLILGHPNTQAPVTASTGLWQGPRLQNSLELALNAKALRS